MLCACVRARVIYIYICFKFKFIIQKSHIYINMYNMYEVEKLKKILITDGYRIDDNDKILLLNPIYQRISEDVDDNFSAKYAYVIAKNNRNRTIEMVYVISYWLSMDF